jgi:hypothetical protein
MKIVIWYYASLPTRWLDDVPGARQPPHTPVTETSRGVRARMLPGL